MNEQSLPVYCPHDKNSCQDRFLLEKIEKFGEKLDSLKNQYQADRFMSRKEIRKVITKKVISPNTRWTRKDFCRNCGI